MCVMKFFGERTWVFGTERCNAIFVSFKIFGGLFDPLGLLLELHALPLLAIFLGSRLAIEVRLARVRIHLLKKWVYFNFY